MEYLQHNGEDLLAHTNGLDRKYFNKVTVGAAIIRHHPNNEKQILLLKRNADEEYYPGIYEMPGGKYEAGDLTIQNALKREIHEETGLVMVGAIRALHQFTYITQKKDSEVVKKVIQLSYVVEAEGVLKTSPQEHSTGGWFTREEVMGLETTGEMRKLVLEALE